MKSYKIYVKLELNGFYQLPVEAYDIKLNLLPILFFMKSMIVFSILLQMPIRSLQYLS